MTDNSNQPPPAAPLSEEDQHRRRWLQNALRPPTPKTDHYPHPQKGGIP
jgi:hypothetical protein